MKNEGQDKLKAMTAGGKIAASVLRSTLRRVKVGVSPLELDRLAERAILSVGARPSFKGFRGYRFATCINLNDGLVHGIPRGDVVIKEGDLVTVDLGVFYGGYHTDCAWTILVGKDKKKEEFLEVGKKALRSAISKVRVGGDVLDISKSIQEIVEESGFSPIREFTGHSVGRKLHEDPLIPCYFEPLASYKLKEGTALAIEVMYAKGDFSLKTDADNWTVRTKDGTICALFEETVFVSPKGPIVLTKVDR